MTWFIFLLIGFALGLEAGRLTAGRPFDWRTAVIAFVIAAIIAAVVAWFRG